MCVRCNNAVQWWVWSVGQCTLRRSDQRLPREPLRRLTRVEIVLLHFKFLLLACLFDLYSVYITLTNTSPPRQSAHSLKSPIRVLEWRTGYTGICKQTSHLSLPCTEFNDVLIN